MSKKGNLKHYAISNGEGENCPKCLKPMERRKRIKPPKNGKTYFFKEWDYCGACSHVQHYDKFKSSEWAEAERQENHFNGIKNETLF